MMSPAHLARPPRLAIWLVDLFAPIDQVESIAGDLLEEFAELAAKSGISFARHWYWRQSIRSIWHFTAHGVRTAPWVIAGAVAAGWLLGAGAFVFTERAVTATLCKYHVYAHINAYLIWLLYGILIERLLQPILIGSFVAAVAKGKEMAATLALSFAICAMSAAALIESRRYWAIPNFRVMPLLITTFISPIMVVVGGITVRRTRLAVSRPLRSIRTG